MIDEINYYASRAIPFLFIIDFDMNKPLVFPLDELPSEILFNINSFKNHDNNELSLKRNFTFKKFPESIASYKKSYDAVYKNLYDGNSYLVNLTSKTKLETDLTLKDIFYLSEARYKLLYKNEFIVFSPEPFVEIRNNKIYSYPMKGTIDAFLPDAKKKILEDEKEKAEHITIVDLIRNDLNMVSKNVKVEKFRYVEKIKTNNKDLYQVSSMISGELENGYQNNLGNILNSLLPAGSISGAPKKKTIEIIKKAESYDRGYYSGIFGFFDGKKLESSVMIRFIENIKNQLYFKSGGGITIYSNMISEYNEMVDKVYVPIY